MYQQNDLIANRYRVLTLLGEGGMGTVWQVFDTVQQSECALKVLSQALDSEEALLQFKQEFWFMTRLRHPNIIAVHEYGVLQREAQQYPYFTMEIVPGQELSELSKIPAEQAWRVLIQASRALGFIHSRQLVHADIKPENLRLTPEGTVKLMDFGLMQPLGRRSTGQLTGTVAYMPPEIPQCGLFTEASDLYSLGVVLYELLAGVQPFVGTTLLDVVKAHIQAEPAPLGSFREDLPQELVQIVMQLLAKDPEARYPNTAALLAAVGRASGLETGADSADESAAYLNSHVLVARDAELSHLNQALKQLQAAQAEGVLIGAPAGVGKSRLLEEFKIQVQLAEMPFCQGICVEQGMRSFAPMIAALNQVIPHTPPALMASHGPMLAHLLPRFADHGVQPLAGFDLKNQKATLFDAVVEWLRAVGQQRPLVLLIDDLHWADLATLELFNYCMRGLHHSAVLLLGAFRDDELLANSPLWQLPEEKVSSFLKLSPFTPEQMAELIQKMLRDVQMPADFVPYFYGATSGNAFFIREMLRYLMEEQLIKQLNGRWIIPDNYSEWQLPSSIGDTIKHRLKRLSAAAADLIEQVAVVGKHIALPLLQTLFAADSDGLFDILDELCERQFLVREAEAFYFPHDRVRETLYQTLDPDRRKDIHQQVGEWLEEQGEAVSTLAYHFKNGRDRVRAMRYLMQAGEQSSVRMEATQLMHESLQILETLPNLPGQMKLLAKHRRQLAWVAYMIHPFICAETNEKLIASMQEAGVPLTEQVEFESILISSYTMIGRNRDALERARSLLKQLEPDTVPYALILFSRLNALLTRGEFRQLVTEMETAAGILKEHLHELPRQLIWAYAFCNFIREDAIAWLGEPVGQDDYAEVPRQIGEQYDFLDLIFWSYYPEVVRNSLIGRYPDIQAVADEIFALIKKMGRPIQHENRFQICLAFAAIEYGDIETGEHYAGKVIELGQRMQNKHQQASGKILQGMIAEQRNHLDDAIQFFSEAVQLSRESETDQLLPGLYRLAGVYLRQNKTELAGQLIKEGLELATGFRLENPYHQIQLYRLRARWLIARHADKGSEAPLREIEAAFMRSIALAEETQNHLQLGLSQLVCARWLGEQSRWEDAETMLRSARKALSSIGYSKGERQVHELHAWLKKQRSQASLQAAEPSPSGIETGLSVPAELKGALPPDQAQELGYRVLNVLKQLNLEPSGGGGGQVRALSERLEKVERVNQFSQLIMKSLDLQMVLNNIMDYVVDIAKADRGMLMLRDDSNQLIVQVLRTAEGEDLPRDQLLNFSKSFTQKVLDTGRALWVQDAQADQELSQQASILALDLRTIICVPLKREEEIIGLIYLDRHAINDAFSSQDLDLVESMGTFATISLINARLHAQIQERNDHLLMLNELSRKISTTLDLPELLQMVLNFCLRITQAEIGYIFISKDITAEPGGFEDLICQVSLDAQERPLEEIQVSKSSIEKVLHDKEPLCVVDMQDEAQLAAQKSVMALELKSVMCVPIYGKEEQILGVVYVSSQAVSQTFTHRDLALMESIIRQVGMDIENRHLMEIRKQQELLNQELALARNIQSSMLPDYIPDIPSLDIIGFSQSADAVGGDYYDYFKISDHEFGLAIGDVNGHGVSASLLMSMAKSCLFVQGKIDPAVIPMMTALNSMIFGGIKERLFMTFVYSIFDLRQHTVTLSSAGHHLPYHYKASDKSLAPVQVKPTYPLGVREKARFNEVTIQLAPHDLLVYYTDGLIEAHTPTGEEFGFERFEQLIVANARHTAAELKQILLKAYEDWVQGGAAEDDLTLVVVKARETAPEPEQVEKKLKTGFLTLINR